MGKKNTDVAMRTEESAEMYLETIFLLEEKKGTVYPIDVREELNYAKSSVSRAMGNLKSRGLITISRENVIKLTDEGRTAAKNIYDRHRILTLHFIALGANKDVAERDACRIEHVISDELFAVIKKSVE